VDAYLDGIGLARLLVQRGVAAIYLIAFVSALQQFRPLLGERGLLPAPRFLARIRFRASPSLFHAHYSDRFLALLAYSGCALSLVALAGLSEVGPLWLSLGVWLALWALYLSIVNVGQVFYGFGWESMLLEAGFFCAFLGPAAIAPSPIPILILRWMLFRVELGAGLIKLRHDRCWRDLTCLYYHYQTQPLPNPLSWYFHRLPRPLHRCSVLFSHFVQLVVPFALFLPQPGALIAGALIVGHQLLLIVSGNYAWLNWLTIALAFSTLSDAAVLQLLPIALPMTDPRTLAHDVVLYALAALTLALSIEPTLNFFSRRQLMNHSYNALHLVNVYGAFGRVTRDRYEIVIEGAAHGGDAWQAYELRAKPGDPTRRPPQIAPYHLRLDWLMWFLPFSTVVDSEGVTVLEQERWFLQLARKLLEGDRALLALLRTNPFPERPPALLRARFYHYEFSDAAHRRATGEWWKRTYVGDYLPPVSLADLAGRTR
jgi:Lipase maturation factor